MIKPAPTPEEIRHARAVLGKKQTDLAAMLGVTHATYNRWEKGHCTPQPLQRERLHKLVALARKKEGKS